MLERHASPVWFIQAQSADLRQAYWIMQCWGAVLLELFSMLANILAGSVGPQTGYTPNRC